MCKNWFILYWGYWFVIMYDYILVISFCVVSGEIGGIE